MVWSGQIQKQVTSFINIYEAQLFNFFFLLFIYLFYLFSYCFASMVASVRYSCLLCGNVDAGVTPATETEPLDAGSNALTARPCTPQYACQHSMCVLYARASVYI